MQFLTLDLASNITQEHSLVAADKTSNYMHKEIMLIMLIEFYISINVRKKEQITFTTTVDR